MQGRSSSSCWFLASQPPIELCGAGVAGIAGIQSLPGSIELRTTRLRCGVPESVGEKRRAGKGGTAAGGSGSRSGGGDSFPALFLPSFPLALLSLALYFFPRSRRKAGSSARDPLLPARAAVSRAPRFPGEYRVRLLRLGVAWTPTTPRRTPIDLKRTPYSRLDKRGRCPEIFSA